MSTNPLRMYEQLRAVWKTRDKDQPFVRGLLLTKQLSLKSNENGNHQNWSTTVVEQWFTLLGHTLFFCTYRDSPEYSGALLTDIFSPVIARVDQKILDEFDVPGSQQVTEEHALYLKGVMVSDVEVLFCPPSAEEKRTWLEKLQKAGLNVPTRSPSERHSRGKDGREKVVVISGSINDSLYLSPDPIDESSHSFGSSGRPWKQEWKKASKKVLSLPDAAQIRVKYGVLQKLLESETRYFNSLHTLVEMYLKQFRTAIASGYLSLQWEQLQTMFLNCEMLLILHKLFLHQLKKTFAEPNPLFGNLILFFIPHMQVYIEFIRNHDKSVKILDACLSNPSFTDFLENHHSSHDCEAQELRMLLHQPVTRLEIYQAFLEEILRQTSEDHVDYKPLGTALEALQDLKQDLSRETSDREQHETILSILKSVGPRAFLLLEPDCRLILEGEMYLPASSKWVTGTIKRRPVHCYLYSNTLVVIGTDKKVKNRSQVFPLNGATVYEFVSKTGEVTYARDPELEVRALKLYSPNGPRNGVVIIFLTQSSKSLWLSKISEMIARLAPIDTPGSPLTPGIRMASSLLSVSIPESPSQPMIEPYSKARRASAQAGMMTGSPPSEPTVNGVRNWRGSSTNLSTTSDGSSGSNSPTSSPKMMRTTSLYSVAPPSIDTVRRSRVQYYSIASLFNMLIANPPDPHFPATFLLTYRMFTNAHEVLDAIIEGHRKDLNSRSKEGVVLTAESLRFFNTLRMWVNKYYVDFHHDVTLKRVIDVYLTSIKQHKFIHEKEVELTDSILRTVNKRGHIPLIRRSRLRIQIPKPLGQIPKSLSEIPSEELANQLTWIEHELYSRIKPYEFLQQKWTKKNRQELAPNIVYVIQRFNQVTLWIAKEILSPDQPRDRCQMAVKMLEVAKHCLELRNFVSTFQIVGVLWSSAIQRLKKTWDLMPQSSLELFSELKKIATVEYGSKVYREKQKSSPSPSVPYIGPYLNQLITIEVGMPTFVEDPPEHVNFSKLTRLAKVIEEVMRFQNPRYPIKSDGAVLTFLDKVVDSASGFDDEQRYSRSIELEPRKPVNGLRKKSELEPRKSVNGLRKKSVTRLLLNGD